MKTFSWNYKRKEIGKMLVIQGLEVIIRMEMSSNTNSNQLYKG